MTIETDSLLGSGQYLFRDSVQRETRLALSRIGLHRSEYVKVYSVALTSQDGKHQVTGVDPENGPFDANDLRSVEEKLAAILEAHPDSDLTIRHPGPYGSREDLPLRRCRAQAIAEAMQESDKLEGHCFFVSDSTPYLEYEIHVCVGLPDEILNSVPSLPRPITDRYGTGRPLKSFAHAIIHTCLESADMALYLPDPGRKPFVLENCAELIRRSADRFINNISLDLTSNAAGLFSAINDISSQTYERSGARGQLIIADDDNLTRNRRVTIKDPVRMLNTRSVRKMLELTDETTALLSDGQSVYGLGMCVSAPNVAKIRIEGPSEWSLSIDDTELIRVSHQQATLPKKLLDRDLFEQVARKTLCDVDTERIWKAFQNSLDSGHGTTIVVSQNPLSEVNRLGQEALAIEPAFLGHEEVARLGRVDGAVFLGPDGRCYAFGVILDGKATDTGDRSRGARFNSAVRYEQESCFDTMAIVISDDGMVDLIPPLMPQKSRTEVEEAVQDYCDYSGQENNDDKKWTRLDDRVRDLGFYLNLDQCSRVNDAYESEMGIRRMNNETVHHKEPLQPHPYMSPSYFITK